MFYALEFVVWLHCVAQTLTVLQIYEYSLIFSRRTLCNGASSIVKCRSVFEHCIVLLWPASQASSFVISEYFHLSCTAACGPKFPCAWCSRSSPLFCRAHLDGFCRNASYLSMVCALIQTKVCPQHFATALLWSRKLNHPLWWSHWSASRSPL